MNAKTTFSVGDIVRYVNPLDPKLSGTYITVINKTDEVHSDGTAIWTCNFPSTDELGARNFSVYEGYMYKLTKLEKALL